MLIYAIFLIAIVTEAISGALMGMRRGMDRFGLALVGSVTALGGGTVRDVVLGHYPLRWIEHPEYVVITFAAAWFASLVATRLATLVERQITTLRTLFVTVDALGLAAFAIIGCDVASTMNLNPFAIVLAGAITGVCGGVLRDLLCNEVPLILREELYVSVALGTGVLYLALQQCGIGQGAASLIALAAGFGARMAAVRFGWRFRTFGAAGKFSAPEDWDSRRGRQPAPHGDE
jgi:uncharacterized membrane protein YeiH